MKKNCQVVFPLYKAPDKIELQFLENGLQKLAGFDVVIVCPGSLIIDEQFGLLADLAVLRFNDEFFGSIAGYNRLMLAPEFYGSFTKYDYVLIHQADVYLFKDELAYWCNEGYAYIGPPWLRKPDSVLKGMFNKLRRMVQPTYGIKHNLVGNGGFSLRHVERSLNVLKLVSSNTLSRYMENDHHLFNEDVFWSIEAPLISSEFNIPRLEEGLRFGIEFQPAYALAQLGGDLPFGCHAPLKHGSDTWKKYIPALQ